MKLNTVQWNIQACRKRRGDADPTSIESYTGDDPPYIANQLRAHVDDGVSVITLQEVHANHERDQAEEIAEYLGLRSITWSYGSSFMDPAYDICQSILTTHPILETGEHRLECPDWPVADPALLDGEYKLKDTVLSWATLQVDASSVSVATLHMQPFQLFNKDPFGDEAESIRESLRVGLGNIGAKALILQGDFNVDTPSILPFVGAKHADSAAFDIPEPTIPGGSRIDHIYWAGEIHGEALTIDSTVLTDHYPLRARFDL